MTKKLLIVYINSKENFSTRKLINTYNIINILMFDKDINFYLIWCLELGRSQDH